MRWLDSQLDHLKATKRGAREIAEFVAAKPELDIPVPDFAEKAWDALKAEGKLPPSRAGIGFSPRRDGCDRPVPNAVFKVPTGGGKTWLAVSGVSRIMGRYLERNTGFVLWLVPNEAFYSQTLKPPEGPTASVPTGAGSGCGRAGQGYGEEGPTRRTGHRCEPERHAADAPIGEPRKPKTPSRCSRIAATFTVSFRRRATSRRIRQRWTPRQTWTPIAACSLW